MTTLLESLQEAVKARLAAKLLAVKVAGCPFAGGNGTYKFYNLSNGKPRYNHIGGSWITEWTNSRWQVYYMTEMCYSDEDVATPDLVTGGWFDGATDQLVPGMTVASASPTVLSRKESDVDKLIEEEVTTGLGIALVVLYPFPARIIQDAPGPPCEEISVQVQIYEDVYTNQTGLSALFLAERVLQWLHLWVPSGVAGVNSAVVAEENDPLLDPPTEPGRNQIVAKFTCSGAMEILVDS